MRKGLIGLLLCLLLLPLLLWFTLPWTAQYLLQQWLQQQGFEQPRLVIQRPSWHRLQIDHLSVGQRREGRLLQLEAGNIDIRFSPQALLRGQIQELRIEQARLAIQADAAIHGRLNPPEPQTTRLSLTNLHPAQLFRYAPSRRLVVAQLELNYSTPEQPLWQARGNIDLEPQLLQGRMQLRRNETALGYLDLGLDPALNLSLSLSRDNRFLLRSSHQLTFPEQSWLLRSDLLLETTYLPDWLAQLQPNFRLPVADPAGQLRLNARLRLPTSLPTQLPELLPLIDLQLDSQASLTTAAGPGFGGSRLELQAAAQLSAGQLSLTVEPGSQLAVTALQQPALSLDHLDAELTQALRLEGHWQHPAAWQHSDLSLALRPQGIKLPQPIELTLGPVLINAAAGKLVRPQYPVSINLADIRLQPVHQPALNLSLHADLLLDRTQQLMSAQAQVSSQQLPLQLILNGELAQDLNGHLDFQLPSTSVAALYSALHPWLPTQLKPLSVQHGTLSSQGSLQLTADRWSLEARPVIRQVNLTWDEHTRVSNLNLSQRVHLNSTGQLRSSGQLEIDHTDSGIRVFGPQLDFDLSLPARGAPRLSLSSFSLSALDGIIAVPPLSFNPRHPVIDTRIAVAALELERILELYPQEGLYGSGVLGGALPLKLDGNQLSISQGQLISQGQGGVIRYQPTPEVSLMGQQNPGIQLALDALTDFRFDLLDLTLDYSPSGDAVMRARLKGRNPGWQQGRPVDLNLNIEENLLDLLRTLRLTDSVTDAIDRRFRR